MCQSLPRISLFHRILSAPYALSRLSLDSGNRRLGFSSLWIIGIKAIEELFRVVDGKDEAHERELDG